MSWAEAMNEHANSASGARVSTDANLMRGTTSTYWSPHNVWLTHVKQPRGFAARGVMASALTRDKKLPDLTFGRRQGWQ